MKVKALVGSGDKIGLLTLPVLLVGVALNVWRPDLFSVGGPSAGLKTVSAIALVVGIVVWLWSAALILTKVPRHELITSGPFAVVKHPLYTGVGLLVIPSVGLLLDTWLGIVIGLVVYIGSRMFSPDEERGLARAFGRRWDEYNERVALPWL